MTLTRIPEIIEPQLGSGEKLIAYGYALRRFRGFCLGLTDKNLILVRIGMFTLQPKEIIKIVRTDISDVHFERGGLFSTGAHFTIRTQSGAFYKFLVVATAGLDGEKNFGLIRDLYERLIK